MTSWLWLSLFQLEVLEGGQLTCMGFKLGQGTARAKAQDGFSVFVWYVAWPSPILTFLVGKADISSGAVC